MKIREWYCLNICIFLEVDIFLLYGTFSDGMFSDGMFSAMGCLVMGRLVMGRLVMECLVMGRLVMGRFVCVTMLRGGGMCGIWAGYG